MYKIVLYISVIGLSGYCITFRNKIFKHFLSEFCILNLWMELNSIDGPYLMVKSLYSAVFG